MTAASTWELSAMQMKHIKIKYRRRGEKKCRHKAQSIRWARQNIYFAPPQLSLFSSNKTSIHAENSTGLHVRCDGEQTTKNRKIKTQGTRYLTWKIPPMRREKNHGRQPANLHYIRCVFTTPSGGLQEELTQRGANPKRYMNRTARPSALPGISTLWPSSQFAFLLWLSTL